MQQANRQDVTRALAKLGLGVLEAAHDSGDIGAPSGTIYAAMMAHGATFNQFQTFMQGLTSRGMLTESGNCFYITEAGKQFMQTLRTKLAH